MVETLTLLKVLLLILLRILFRAMAAVSVNWAVAAITAVCILHVLLYRTTYPVLTITATALLFLPVYARRLQIPVRHPFKTIAYYTIWTQITYSTIWSVFLEVAVVIGLFLYTRRALKKLPASTLDSEPCIKSIHHEANASLPSNKDSETALQDNETHDNQMEPTLSAHVDMSQLQSELPEPALVIKSWPFKAAAVLIGYVGLFALVENYLNSTRHLVPYYRVEHGTRIHPFLRGLNDQAYYAVVLVAIQGYMTLPSGSFKIAATSLLAPVNWVYVGIYLLPVNLALLAMFEMTEGSVLYPYLLLVWDILFSSGLHCGIALAYVWCLCRVCLQSSLNTPTQEDGNPREEEVQQHQQQQREPSNMEPSVPQAAVQDRIALDSVSKHDMTHDNPDVVGIDIADLSSLTHTTEVAYGDDD